MPVPDRESISSYWDAAADTFDDEADHGLRDLGVRAAWAGRLRSWMPRPPSDVLDLGCGTGSLTLLLAEQGHRPVGLDLSPRMAETARRKLASAGFAVTVLVGDASDPPAAGASFDVVLARHLMWTLPAPERALRTWMSLLRPHGRLVLIEGNWRSSDDGPPYVAGAHALPWLGGVSAGPLLDVLRPYAASVRVEPLTDPVLWGKTIHDERYAVIARR
ncbi:class I SAM-dependent methyltransferase [Microbispora triticiradicis]|uniref:Class I SAM-dependent methyltransferase n=2 Tax=Microbispora triticiradicis TaxID=2200763 RepID=A0A5R8YIT5_9ACTN|nr:MULTISPECIES: class I SAM-dependent methyltransferase [Microbispora]RGA06338.1 class I SAM-dependent methyltransferase [Microbispora triticiradicis]TLP52138.1 class I SAM-dependent methyltransferase [Microbispora fusca]